ncbi:MAG TPA: transglycosylase SLT domain-containing protein [Pyrinomonadaceae bacterium]|jgi:membrane-bound lytic murein transglycosylase D
MRKSSLYLAVIWVFFACANIFGQSQSVIMTEPEYPELRDRLDFGYYPHPMIKQYINYYQGRGRAAMEFNLTRSGQLSAMIKQIFRQENVPESLVVMSQYSNEFHSAGLWLIDARVAEKYGLRRTKFIDETRGFERATRAVAQYLKFLSEKYKGNWELAIAAYFTGERDVDRAVRRAGIKDFWIVYVYLPKYTRNFVPNVLASAIIANHREFFGFKNIQPDSPLAYDLVRLPPSISLDLIAQFSESNPENIKRLNPELISTVTPPQNYIVRLPSGKAYIFRERLRRYTQDEKMRRNNKSANR